MSEHARTGLTLIAIVCAFQAMKWLFGVSVSLTVAVAAFSFCIGALWGAGAENSRTKDGGE